MFDYALHAMEHFISVFTRMHGAVRDYFFYVAEFTAWGKTLTAIGGAYMTRMIPLRVMAMLNNLFGITTGVGNGSLATFIEHAVNLPLNTIRLREMRRLIASVRQASETDLKIDWLKPFMHLRALKIGSRVFSAGDKATEAFILTAGRIVIPEKSVTLEPGAIFGEMALFSAAGCRTASAVCASDVRLLVITYEQFEQLYFQNPEFGFYLVRLIVRRYEMRHSESAGAGVAATG
ncbi:MAG TPA: cyclic nucleotide-binding domain-containing protein [Methylocella sp.]|nr:cyclic nucleotide-binding domain-containing protein [Methylocella sp.]